MFFFVSAAVFFTPPEKPKIASPSPLPPASPLVSPHCTSYDVYAFFLVSTSYNMVPHAPVVCMSACCFVCISQLSSPLPPHLLHAMCVTRLVLRFTNNMLRGVSVTPLLPCDAPGISRYTHPEENLAISYDISVFKLFKVSTTPVADAARFARARKNASKT